MFVVENEADLFLSEQKGSRTIPSFSALEKWVGILRTWRDDASNASGGSKRNNGQKVQRRVSTQTIRNLQYYLF